MVDGYTKVLETVAELGDEKAADAAVAKLVAHLKSAGRMKMLPQIARELRKVAARRAALMPKVEVAHKKDAARALASAKEAGVEAGEVKVNESLISGWRGMGGGRLVDRSGKRALADIYKKVTG